MNDTEEHARGSHKEPENTSEPSSSSTDLEDRSYEIVIIGGGEAGLTVAETLVESTHDLRIALIEPTSYKYDQPMWVRVGTEGVHEEATRSPEDLHVPTGVDWIQDRVSSIDAEGRVVRVEAGAPVSYEYLVVATGIGPRWDRIRGLEKKLGTGGICSVYGYEQASRTWEMIRNFEGGRAVFTAPAGPFKGGTTPLSVLHRANEVWRETGVREQTELFFATATGPEFAGEEYPEMLQKDEEDVHVYGGYELIEVRPQQKEAVFRVQKGESESRHVLAYDLIHVVPPMRPPAVIEHSALAYQEGPLRGYLKVIPESLRHKQFETVFGVGDVGGDEGVKTGTKAREQAVEVATTLQRLTAGAE